MFIKLMRKISRSSRENHETIILLHLAKVIFFMLTEQYFLLYISGGRFAQLTVVAGLAAMLSKMEVEPCALTTSQIEYDPRSVMLKNKGGIHLRFKAI